MSGDDDEGTPVAENGDGSDERTDLILAGLNRLDAQYQDMKETQSALLQALEKLEKEEVALSQARVICQEPTKPKPRPKTKDEAAIKRLQEALLNEDDSDEDDDDSDA